MQALPVIELESHRLWQRNMPLRQKLLDHLRRQATRVSTLGRAACELEDRHAVGERATLANTVDGEERGERDAVQERHNLEIRLNHEPHPFGLRLLGGRIDAENSAAAWGQANDLVTAALRVVHHAQPMQSAIEQRVDEIGRIGA